jgi:cell division protein DivIC
LKSSRVETANFALAELAVCITFIPMNLPPFISPILRVMRSFYFLTGVGFLVWMLVFDANDLGKQFDIYRKWQDLRNEKQYYLDNIELVKKDRAELMSSPALLEKFAREKYLMKRPGEDVFVLVPATAE